MLPNDDEYTPGNGGSDNPLRTPVGGNAPLAGAAHVLAARAPTAPAGPDPDGAYMMQQARPNAGGNAATIQATPQGGAFGSYTGRSADAGPHQAGVRFSGSAQISQPTQGEALSSFISMHSPAQRTGGGQQQGGQQSGPQSSGPAEDEAPEAADAAEAGAGEAAGADAAASIPEALALL